LLSVSIGPVQEFIAEARKTRDLWAGSYLLSKVTFNAMQTVINKYGQDAIILPDISASSFYKMSQSISVTPEEKTYASIPNHFLALIPEDKTNEIVKEIKDRVENFLLELGKDIRDTISHSSCGKEYTKWDTLWDFQLKDHFNVMWVSIPATLDDLKNDYKAKYNDIQRFMEERKITRTFDKWQGNSAVKCGQCGHREVIGPPEFGQSRDFWNLLRKNKVVKWRVKKTERLCAVCLVKRLVKEDDLCKGMQRIQFESTSDIASLPFRRLLIKYKDEPSIKNLLEKLSNLKNKVIGGTEDIPGDWFYKEGLDANRIEREFSVDITDELKDVSKKAQEALDAVYKKVESEPSKYYAIIIMDADKMGKYISGEHMPQGQTFSLEWQTNQSKILSEIGCEKFPEIIKNWDGRTIYSGGDDLLAFGPLDGALSTIKELRESFITKTGLTTSACLTIFHHQDSLKWAIEEARIGLEKAKEDYNRDSLIISLQLSSGSSFLCGYHWDFNPDGASGSISFTDDIINNMVRWMTTKPKGLSPAFVYDLLTEMPAFYYVDHHKQIHLKQPEMFETECWRLLKRHIPKDSSIWGEEGNINTVIKSLIAMADPSKHSRYNYSFDTKENLESLLKLIAFLTREEG
jgi:CRISPR-associated protein Cmr2